MDPTICRVLKYFIVYTNLSSPDTFRKDKDRTAAQEPADDTQNSYIEQLYITITLET
jgi:hypothetical protein